MLGQNSGGWYSQRWSWSGRLRAQLTLPALLWLRIMTAAGCWLLLRAWTGMHEPAYMLPLQQQQQLQLQLLRVCVPAWLPS